MVWIERLLLNLVLVSMIVLMLNIGGRIVKMYSFIVKDKSKATSLVGIAPESESKVKIIKELKDPKNTHPYNMKGCIKDIKEQLRRNNIDIESKEIVPGT